MIGFLKPIQKVQSYSKDLVIKKEEGLKIGDVGVIIYDLKSLAVKGLSETCL